MNLYQLALIVTLVPLAIAALAFWVWMLLDCLQHEPREGNDKVAWTIVIVVLQLFGAILYFFVRRPQRPLAESSGGHDSPALAEKS